MTICSHFRLSLVTTCQSSVYCYYFRILIDFKCFQGLFSIDMKGRITAILTVCALVLLSNIGYAQTAPDWTLTDINGQEHNLYDDLDAGKTVIIDFFATWCSLCWNAHSGGVLQDMYAQHGPDGDDTYRIYMIEGFPSTDIQDLLGNTNGTQGNWIQGNDIPIIESAQTGADYGILGFPTYFIICPEDRSLNSLSPTSIAAIQNQAGVCPPFTGGPDGGGSLATRFQGTIGLQGYQNGGQMSTSLAANGLLPMSQPFNTAPFNYAGNETISTIPSNTVDWVLLELRDANNESIVVDTKAALVDQNGNIMDISGSPGVNFDTAPNGNYFVVVHHAGHVSIMSSTTVSIPNASPYNFTTGNNTVQGIDQLTSVGGTFSMRSGDYDNNGTVNFSDFIRWLQNNNALNAYAAYDADGSGTVNFTDFILWLSNNNHLAYSGI